MFNKEGESIMKSLLTILHNMFRLWSLNTEGKLAGGNLNGWKTYTTPLLIKKTKPKLQKAKQKQKNE